MTNETESDGYDREDMDVTADQYSGGGWRTTPSHANFLTDDDDAIRRRFLRLLGLMLEKASSGLSSRRCHYLAAPTEEVENPHSPLLPLALVPLPL